MRCDNCGWENRNETQRCEKCNQPLKNNYKETTSTSFSTTRISLTRSTVSLSEMPTHTIDTDRSISTSRCTTCGYPLSIGTTLCPNCGNSAENIDRNALPHNNTSDVPTNHDPRATVKLTPEQLSVPEFSNDQRALKKTVAIDHDSLAKELDTFVEKSSSTDLAQENVADTKATVVLDLATMSDFASQAITSDTSTTTTTSLTSLDGGAIQRIELNGDNTILNRNNIACDNHAIDTKAQAEIVCEDGAWYIRNLSPNQNTYLLVERKTKLEKGDVILIGNQRFIFE